MTTTQLPADDASELDLVSGCEMIDLLLPDMNGLLRGKRITRDALSISDALVDAARQIIFGEGQQLLERFLPINVSHAIRQLGPMSTTRTTLAPNVPTFKEQGYDIVMASMRASDHSRRRGRFAQPPRVRPGAARSRRA